MDDNLIDNYNNTEEIIKNNNTMPQNLEAEQSLLGSILFDNKLQSMSRWLVMFITLNSWTY